MLKKKDVDEYIIAIKSCKYILENTITKSLVTKCVKKIVSVRNIKQIQYLLSNEICTVLL